MSYPWTGRALALAAAAMLSACGGGGGGGATEARVGSLSSPLLLEGAAGTSEMVFTVTLNKPSLAGVRVTYSTASTAKAGGGGTGSATGGAACGAGIDYVAISPRELFIPAGASSGEVRVTVCGDAEFEPNETLAVNWSQAGTSGSATGTIVNDDAGGLNGTAVAGSFGRDSLALTNSDADGRLGFSFANVAGGAITCIRDNVTGLLWEGKTAGNAATTSTFAGLTAIVNAANAGAGLCGFTDWHVPTPQELGTLVDAGTAATPTSDPTFITRQQAGHYWTSSDYRDGLGTNAWFVDYATGTVSLEAKTRTNFVRLVSRGGTTPPAPAPLACNDALQYTDHGDGTVTDKRTGLMWKQCAEGLSGATCASGSAGAFSWDTALARPAASNGAADLGYTDWRLPTRAELSSIADREQCFNPAINPTAFPNTGLSDYWTSTPYAQNATLAWRINFSDGEVAPALKTDAIRRVRLVRAGQ